MPESTVNNAGIAAQVAPDNRHEFTGERVIPGMVDVNLWNEHVARYAFASRLSRQKRVLDIGCGTGYGSFELARSAHAITAIDVSAEALTYADQHFHSRNLTLCQASATALPLTDDSFDLVVAFEVIEHLADWKELLIEARRVLTPGGQFIVSTPNKLYYAESRKQSGPNPFHEHEFEYQEFIDALHEFFPHVSVFLEDHAEGILFHPAGVNRGAELRIEQSEPSPETANFFIAVCATVPQTGAPAFAYVPKSANILREREVHIERLEKELKTKDEWLAKSHAEHNALVEQFRELNALMEERNAWAAKLDTKLKAASERISQLQEEVESTHAGYQAKIDALEAEMRTQTEWAQKTASELEAKGRELVHCVELLDKAEATVRERTDWAMRLDAERNDLAAKLNMVQASRWVRIGRKIGVGPQLQDQ